MELVSRRYEDTVVLIPAGRIDHATADAFRSALAPYLAVCAAGRDRLVLDLSRVEYLASVGLRALMLASRQATAQGGTLVVAALQPLVQEIFEISKFSLVFETFPSVREALARVSPPALAAFEVS